MQEYKEAESLVFSRRMFLSTVVSGVAALGLAASGCSLETGGSDPKANKDKIQDPFCDTPEGFAHDAIEYPPVFADQRAEATAADLFINPGSYFKLNPEAIKAVNDAGDFRRTDWVAPIFPPAVMKFEEDIIKAANEFNIPASILASLATIESAGRTSAVSGADAHGIVQVVPRYHRDRIDQLSGRSFASDEERSAYLRDNPAECLRIGASYFAECVSGAQRMMPRLRPDSMVIYARAAAAYNGGPSRAGQNFDQLPLESKLYVNHVARLTLDVAIAAKLIDQGLDNDETLRAMQSIDVNARAKVYDALDRGRDFQRYEESAELCSTPTPGVDPESGVVTNETIKQIYENYIANCKTVNEWQAPAVPGLRIWLVGGGTSLFLSEPQNAAWRVPNTH